MRISDWSSDVCSSDLDAEHLIGHLGQAAAKRHVEMLQCDLAEMVGAGARRHHDGGQRAGVVARILAQDLEAPGAHGPACRLGMAVVAREDVVEAFLLQHVDGLGEAVEQVRSEEHTSALQSLMRISYA